jgi:tripartite-type tricarboxylate transporter receptor subunit TctC
VSAVRVPYKGGAQLMPDLMSGLVQLNFGPIPSGLQHVKSGKLKAFVTLLPQRSPLLPDVPSAAELGLPLGNLPTWNGLLAPASTPAEVIARISGAVVQAMRNPALRSAIEQLGASPLGTTPQVMADSMERATTAWRTFVREHDIPQE